MFQKYSSAPLGYVPDLFTSFDKAGSFSTHSMSVDL